MLNSDRKALERGRNLGSHPRHCPFTAIERARGRRGEREVREVAEISGRPPAVNMLGRPRYQLALTKVCVLHAAFLNLLLSGGEAEMLQDVKNFPSLREFWIDVRRKSWKDKL